MAGDFGRFPRLTVVNRVIVGNIAKLAPGSVGSAETVDAVGVINNGDRLVLGQNSGFQ